LNACRVLLKDFGQLVEKTTLAIKDKAKTTVTALLAARKAEVDQLTKLAA
jgi:hypothetical protein